MIAKIPKIVLILSIGLLLIQQSSSQLVSRKIWVPYDEEYSMIQNQTIYVNFAISEVKPGYDLTITARPLNARSDPDLYLSSINMYPNSTKNSQYSSYNFGYTSIDIPNSEIIADQILYLGVKCSSPKCDFNLTISFAKDVYLAPQYDLAILRFVTLDTAVLRVAIPANSTASRIVFAIEVENEQALNEEVQMFINQGETIPDSDNCDMVASLAWKDGKAASIQNSDSFFCTGCNYTIVIQAQVGVNIEFTKTLYGSIINFEFDTSRYDAIEAGGNVTYMVDLTNVENLSSETIVIEVNPYYGTPTFYAALNNLPSNLSQYEWVLDEWGVQKLTITPDERAMFAGKSKTLYVTVSCYTPASYFLIIKGRSNLNNHIYIGETETGYALKGERVNYTFFFDSSENTSLSFNLYQEAGGNSDLYVKSCTNKEDCYFTSQDISGLLQGTTQPSSSYPVMSFSNVEQGDQHITVNLNPFLCDNDTSKAIHSCSFAVMINNEDDKTSHYAIQVWAPERINPLRVGYSTKHHILEEEWEFFYFTVTDDSQLAALSFQLTEIAGYVLVFTSRTEKYPDTTNFDNVMVYEDKITYTKKHYGNLNGTYYLGVVGASAATFTIVPTLTFNNQTAENTTMIQLKQGVPQRAVHTVRETGLFIVKTQYSADDNIEALEFVLDNVEGLVQMCINNNNTVPVFGQCTWMTNFSRISIQPDDPNFKLNSHYIIAVFPRPRINGSYDNMYSYAITFSTLMHFNDLMTGYLMFAEISKDKPNFYKFLLHPDTDTEATISITQMTNDQIGIYISSVAEGLTNLESYNYSAIGNGSFHMVLNKATIQDFCTNREWAWSKCYAYVALTTNNTYFDYPAITLRKDFTDMHLAEGQEFDFLFPNKNHTLKFYYYAQKMEDITVLVNSFQRTLQVYVSVFNYMSDFNKTNWPYPNASNSEYSKTDRYNDQTSIEIVVPSEDLSFCGSDSTYLTCVVLISVQSYEIPGISDEQYDDCEIMVTQEITPVKIGVPVRSSVVENSYRYFRVRVDRETANVLISLTVLTDNGDTFMFMAYGEHSRPTFYNSEYWTQSGGSETVQFGNEDLTYQQSMAGIWIIGVYGDLASDFTLLVAYEDHRIVQLRETYPQDIEIAKNDELFFYYDLSLKKDLKIILSPMYGSASIYVNLLGENDPLIGNFPSKTNYTWMANTEASRNIIQISKTDPHMIAWSQIFIGVYPHSDLKGTIVITGDDGFVYLTPTIPIMDFCNPESPSKYEMTLGSTNYMDVDVLVHANAPSIYVAHNPLVNSTYYLWKFDQGMQDGGVIQLKVNNTEYVDQKLPSVWNGSKNITSNSDKFYIYVASPDSTSNYTITASRNSRHVRIIENQLIPGFLNHEEQNTYTYTSNVNSTLNQKIKLVLTIFRDEFSNEEQNKAAVLVNFYPKGSEGQPTQVEFVTSDEINSLHGPVAYRQLIQFIADKGTYDFTIRNNNEEFPMNYSIVINGKNPFSLPMDTFYLSRLAVNDNDKFIVHAGAPGDIVLQVFECFGKISIQVSKSASIFKKNPLDDTEGEDHIQVGLHFVEHSVKYITVPVEASGTLYVRVNALQGIQDNDQSPEPEAVYKIQASLFAKGKAPLTNLIFPGKDGSLNYEVNNNEITVQFEEPSVLFNQQSSNSKAVSLNFKYDLFFGMTDKVVDSLARCDFVPNQQGMFKKAPLGNYHQTFDSDQVEAVQGESQLHQITTNLEDFDTNSLFTTLRVTVNGMRSDGSVAWSYPVVYNTIDAVVKASANNRGLKILLIISGSVLIGAIIGLVIYVKKYKKVKARLMYETQDIRNVAASVNSDDTLEAEIERGPKPERYIELVNEPKETHFL